MSFRIPFRRTANYHLTPKGLGQVDRNFEEVEKQLNLFPVRVFNADANAQVASSTSTVTLYDGTDIWVAPVPGVLLVSAAGRVGFNGGAVRIDTKLSADNGDTAGSSQSFCQTYAAAGQFGPMATHATHSYSAGEPVGFTISFSANIGTGTNYLRSHVHAVFYPTLP